jgi:hypothetical protein
MTLGDCPRAAILGEELSVAATKRGAGKMGIEEGRESEGRWKEVPRYSMGDWRD